MPASSPTPRPRPSRLAPAVMVVLALLVAACSGGGDDETTSTSPLEAVADERRRVAEADLGPFAVDAGPLSGPGTPLGGGISVPGGALLQGVPFPDLVGGGYRAVLLLTGDPVEVFNGLGEQARGLGMVGPGACLGDEAAVRCSGTYVDASDGEELTVELARGQGEGGLVSGVGVRYRPPGSVEGGADEEPSAPTAPLPVVALPAGPIEQPDGADVGRALRPVGSPVRSVERGSELVGLPAPCACGDGGGWSFVVELTGVVRDVVAAYGRQLSDLGDPPDVSDTHRDDVTLMGLRVGEAEGPHGEVRAVVPDESPAYAIVTLVGT